MGKRHFDRTRDRDRRDDRPCWREVLFCALSGLQSTDHHVQQLLDYLERAT